LGYASYQSFSVSNEGIILLSSEANRYQLTWFSRVGNVLSTVGQPERYAALRIAPDGGRTAIVLVDSSGNRDIWQMDLARGAQTRITTNGRGFVAVWSPDGQRLAYHTAYAPYLFERFCQRSRSGGNGSAIQVPRVHQRLVSGWPLPHVYGNLPGKPERSLAPAYEWGSQTDIFSEESV
jgi:hypothetical protein